MAVIEKPYGLTINEAVGMCLEVYRDDLGVWQEIRGLGSFQIGRGASTTSTAKALRRRRRTHEAPGDVAEITGTMNSVPIGDDTWQWLCDLKDGSNAPKLYRFLTEQIVFAEKQAGDSGDWLTIAAKAAAGADGANYSAVSMSGMSAEGKAIFDEDGDVEISHYLRVGADTGDAIATDTFYKISHIYTDDDSEDVPGAVSSVLVHPIAAATTGIQGTTTAGVPALGTGSYMVFQPSYRLQGSAKITMIGDASGDTDSIMTGSFNILPSKEWPFKWTAGFKRPLVKQWLPITLAS